MVARRRRRYRTIPEDAKGPILDLADQYPGVGQDGLQDEVERMGYRVDPHELKVFLREHGRRPPHPGYRRRGMWDTGWPTWGYRNPVGDMEWPRGEPFEHRFPYWGWMGRQPLWFRLIVGVGLVAPTLGYFAIQLWNMVNK